ncbi:MAG: hypothetical protein WHT09_13370 [Thermogutta sp.]
MDIPAERWPGCTGTRGISGFAARPEAAQTVRWFKPSDRPDSRSGSSGRQVQPFPEPQWEDHWWLDAETRASGGTYENATYDEYNYQYQWTKTWLGQGESTPSPSASNHVTGVENGSSTSWWGWSVTSRSGSTFRQCLGWSFTLRFGQRLKRQHQLWFC